MQVAELGAQNALVQLTLKLTAPGVPDTYQGSEWWNLSLVDPDNRRPVDYAARQEMLAGLVREHARDARGTVRRARDDWQRGAIKMLVTWRLLRLRRELPDVFGASHEPCAVQGGDPDKVIAFARQGGGRALVTAVARFPVARALSDSWRSSHIVLPPALAGRAWRDVLSDGRVPSTQTLECGALFDLLPVAVLLSD
jgi:(1->4)-alpha-D-glucan 1-alpha-D-glucosylmutase